MTALTWHSALNLTVGSVEVLLALTVAALLRRYGKPLPWLVVLMAFFLLRGADRIYLAFAGSKPIEVAMIVDGSVLLVLVLMLVGIRRTVRTLDLLDRDARLRQEEYARALADYRRLARHRLANPITTITGAIATLEARPGLTEERRAELLRLAHEAAERLKDVALEPTANATEESELHPRPRHRRFLDL